MSGYLVYLLLVLFSVLGAGFALWKGGTAERIAAGVFAANLLIDFVARTYAPDSESLVRLANDGLAAVALLIITVLCGSLWMGGVMLFYAAQFSLHSYYLVIGRPEGDRLHAMVNNLDWSGVIWCLIIGTAMSWRQRARAPQDLEPMAAL